MLSEDKQIIRRVLERYVQTGSTSDEQVKVTCLPMNKNSHVEQIGEDGRILLLDEYQLDGKVIWASYSLRSKTVYFSLKGIPEKSA